MTKDIVLTATERVLLRQFAYPHGRVMSSSRVTIAKLQKLGFIYEASPYARQYKVYKVTDLGKAYMEQTDYRAIKNLPTARRPVGKVEETLREEPSVDPRTTTTT